MITRRIAVAATLAFLIAAPVALAQITPPVPPISDAVAKAVASSTRPEKDKARDGGRKPAEVFAISGIKPGDKVIEIAAFGQYDTNIMVNIVGPTGHIYMYDLPYQQARQEAPTKVFTDAHPTTEHFFGKFDEMTFPSNVDLVTIDMYYHDLSINNVNLATFNKKMFDALKPGGRLLIVDHNAEPGSGRRDTNTLHRIDKPLIPAEVQAAGFKLVTDSNLFANPKDDYKVRVFDPTERGGTDRSVFVFEKPR